VRSGAVNGNVRPFLFFVDPGSSLILHRRKALDRVTWKEFVQYKNQVPADLVKYWDNALANGAEIAKLAEAGLLGIRERSRRWESFDPGP
jgi:hypothetical protein